MVLYRIKQRQSRLTISVNELLFPHLERWAVNMGKEEGKKRGKCSDI